MGPLSLDQPWGRGFRPRHHHYFFDAAADAPAAPATPWLPRGLGRSYGDVCINDGGALLHTYRHDRLLAFDAASGILTAEAGASIADITAVFLPRGWFLPVVPGTRFVTLGGAVANDVHGKNHGSAGTFGCHVKGLRLRRSDCAGPFDLSPGDPLFAATVGGLGLTGLIETVSVRLERIPGPWIEQETQLFEGIAGYHALEDASADWPYTVGWIDTLDKRLRGVFFRGRHAASAGDAPARPPAPRRIPPVGLPSIVLGRMTARAFNALYYRAQQAATAHRRQLSPYPFFWPLDALANWNRLYGRNGFLQYQLVVPRPQAETTIEAILALFRREGLASYLAVIKRFGSVRSPGLLSFPLAGTTVALDIPAPDARVHAVLDAADALVVAAGGRLYPAKDARMKGTTFCAGYPNWERLEALRDPAVSSSFWRRVTRLS